MNVVGIKGYGRRMP